MTSPLRHRRFDRSILDSGRVLDLGCGRKKLPGAVGVDHEALPEVDVVCDLNGALPFADATFEIVYADQVVEHIRNLVGLVYEVLRVLRPGGSFIAHAPYFRSGWAHIDPTHVHGFTISTFDYFVRGTYCYEHYRFAEAAFESGTVYLDSDYPSTLPRAVFSNLALRRPFRFENSLLSFIYPFEQITYVLTKRT